MAPIQPNATTTMKARKRVRHRFLTLILLALIAVTLYALYTRHDHHQRITITLQWARLTPVPASARDVRIDTPGSMFTRAFRAQFTAPKADIDAWLAASPGPRETTPQTIAPDKRKYEIHPGGGAGHAELTVDDTAETVDIYVYWS